VPGALGFYWADGSGLFDVALGRVPPAKGGVVSTVFGDGRIAVSLTWEETVMMTAETLSDRYLTLWMTAPSASGTEQVASDVMAALETSDAFGLIVARWHEAIEVVASAVSLGDEQARVYHEEKISVYTQFVSEWLATN